jgi:hypothetical protein
LLWMEITSLGCLVSERLRCISMKSSE